MYIVHLLPTLRRIKFPEHSITDRSKARYLTNTIIIGL